jgi:hypothetical protein
MKKHEIVDELENIVAVSRVSAHEKIKKRDSIRKVFADVKTLQNCPSDKKNKKC